MKELLMRPQYLMNRSGQKIAIRAKDRGHTLMLFFAGVIILSILSFCCLGVNWGRLASRSPQILEVFWKLGHISLDQADLVFVSLFETISIAVLSLLYSLLLGIVFGMFAARNVFGIPALSVFVQSFFSFLRAVPTPIWVLLMLVCIGIGPEAGVAGLCVHTTAFFTKSFAQSFEEIPDETLEAIEATGAGKVIVFMNAVLPAAFSQIVAWCGMRLEVNFSECAILGMVGAGGIGFVIANSIQGYDFGTAGLAILLVFLTAFLIERMFIAVKRIFK